MIYKLSDICEYVNGKVDISKLDFCTFISTENMLSNKAGIIESSALPNIKQTQIYRAGDVLVSNIRPYFKKIWYATYDGGCSNDVLVFRAKNGVSKRFLYYVLADDNFFSYSMLNSKGTKMPRGDKKAIMEYKVPKFSYEEQVKIAKILGDLDDKVAVNKAINRNLSEQLKAIFSKMFPTITDNGSNTLEEIISFSNGKKRPDTEGKVPVYGGNGILSYTDKSNAENCVIIGRVGAYCGSLYLSVEPCWISDNAIKAKAKNSNSQMFIYYLLQELALSNRHIGTSQPLLTQGILNAIPFNCPSEEDVISFCNKADDIQKLIDMNTIENKRLSELRDTLLPKLMSGELDVSDLYI